PLVAVRCLSIQTERLGRGIVAGKLARRLDLPVVPSHQAQVERPWTEQTRGAAGQGNDGGFEAMRGRAAIHNQLYAAAEAGEDMPGAGRADPLAGLGGR